MDRSLSPPSPRDDEPRDQVIVLSNVAWTDYESLLRARGDARRPRLAFLDGELEIMTTSMRHELDKTLLARLVEAYAEESELELIGAGNATFKKKAKQAGLEPDECYWLDKLTKSPQLAIELVHTSGGIHKLEIYRRLKVREVWFRIEGQFWVYGLGDGEYQQLRASAVLPGIDLDEVTRILIATEDDRQTSAVRAYRKALQRRRAAAD